MTTIVEKCEMCNREFKGNKFECSICGAISGMIIHPEYEMDFSEFRDRMRLPTATVPLPKRGMGSFFMNTKRCVCNVLKSTCGFCVSISTDDRHLQSQLPQVPKHNAGQENHMHINNATG